MAGLFANTLPLRVVIDEKMDLLEFLKYLQKKLIRLTNYEYTSLNDICKYSEVPMNIIQDAIRERSMVFLNFPLDSYIGLSAINSGVTVRDDSTNGALNVPLRLYIIPDEKIGIEVRYNKNAYSDG